MFLGKSPRARFIPEQRQSFRRRTDEQNVFVHAPRGERGVLAQKPISGVNGIATVLLRCRNDPLDIQVGARPIAGKRGGAVRSKNVQRAGIVFGIDRDGGNIELGGGPRDPNRDFAAVGD